jgi:hypothetical protein
MVQIGDHAGSRPGRGNNDIRRLIARPRTSAQGSSVVLLGQVRTMDAPSRACSSGCWKAIVLIYLLIVVISSRGPIPS